MKTVKIFDLIGAYANTQKTGEALYDALIPDLQNGETLILDFQKVEIFTCVFFNHSLCRLYDHFSPGCLNSQLRIENLSGYTKGMLRACLSNAKVYYKAQSVQLPC